MFISEEFAALKVISDGTEELRKRNLERVQAMKMAMGKKFVLHPDNSPRRKKEKKVLK